MEVIAIRKCCFCSKEIGRYDGHHIYRCKNKQKDLDKKETRFLYLKFNFPEISNKNNIKKLYIDELKSLPDIRSLYNIDFKSTIFLLDYFNILRRDYKSSATIASKKIQETCLIKYGTTNVLSKGTSIYHKRNESVKRKYGVDNVFQIKEIIAKICCDENYIKKYGITRKELISRKLKQVWANLTDEQKYEWLNKSLRSDKSLKKRNEYSISKLESRIACILVDLKIDFEQQFIINSNNKKKLYDFLFKKYNLILEVQGDYWHANPECYKENDIIHYHTGYILAKDVWKKDIEKRDIAISKKYMIIYLWEKDIRALKDDRDLALLLLNKMKECIVNETSKDKIN